MNVKLIVDSSADLPHEIIEKYNIAVIPLRVFDETEKEYFDGVNIQAEELMVRMKNGERFTSSLPSYESIYQTFVSYCIDHHCLYFPCSGDLSGTYNFAKLVRLDIIEQFPNALIDIIDTRSVSLGIGVLVMELIESLNTNEKIESVIDQLKNSIKNIQHIFTVDELQYLIRGGRVGKFAGFLGGMLNINPIMEVSEGIFKPLEKVRGRKKALNQIIELMKSRKDEEKTIVGLVYGEKDPLIEKFINQMQDIVGADHLIINSIGAVVGVHTGPSALGIFFLSKKY
ncbi:DegV family protein [Gottfriedia luciferensis]|uniref:DegV family protein n=1 Tax=Gottfriedia luciferensis TaxID=178774 RepID=UPI000B4305DE|nr:DegV family protein [Gottfriedia luciferensis]